MKTERLYKKMEEYLDSAQLLEHDKKYYPKEEREKKYYQNHEDGCNFKYDENKNRVYYQSQINDTFTDEDFDQYFKLKLLGEISKMEEEIHTLKNCNVFFVVLAVVSIILTFVIFVNLL